MRARSILPTALVIATVGLAACSAGASTQAPSSRPSASVGPSVPPTVGPIAHPLGAAEIVLRWDVGGGFVGPSFFKAHVPNFTLYGDGTLVWVSQAVGSGDNVPSTGQPLRTGRFSEEQVQALLAFALGDGGLGIARSFYPMDGIADGPTTTFTIAADGRARTVSVYALGLDGQPGPDSAIRTRFKKLAERLVQVDANGTAVVPYEAPAYRGVLNDASGLVDIAIFDWPWASIAPAAFVAGTGADANVDRRYTLTPAEVAALGVPGFQNGITGGLFLRGPDRTIYALVVRPLLPDETS